jgi:hypothetical protein
MGIGKSTESHVVYTSRQNWPSHSPQSAAHDGGLCGRTATTGNSASNGLNTSHPLSKHPRTSLRTHSLTHHPCQACWLTHRFAWRISGSPQPTVLWRSPPTLASTPRGTSAAHSAGELACGPHQPASFPRVVHMTLFWITACTGCK